MVSVCVRDSIGCGCVDMVVTVCVYMCIYVVGSMDMSASVCV